MHHDDGPRAGTLGPSSISSELCQRVTGSDCAGSTSVNGTETVPLGPLNSDTVLTGTIRSKHFERDAGVAGGISCHGPQLTRS